MKFIKPKKPITVNHKKLRDAATENGTLTIAAEKVEIPQYESLAEYVQALKGDSNALAYINKKVENDTKALGRSALNTAEDTAVVDELYTKTIAAMKNFTPDGDIGGASVKTKAEQRDALKARLESGETVSREELLAMLA